MAFPLERHVKNTATISVDEYDKLRASFKEKSKIKADADMITTLRKQIKEQEPLPIHEIEVRHYHGMIYTTDTYKISGNKAVIEFFKDKTLCKDMEIERLKEEIKLLKVPFLKRLFSKN